MRTENISNHWNIVDYRHWRLPTLDNLTQNQLGWSLDGLGFIFTPKKMNRFFKTIYTEPCFFIKGQSSGHFRILKKDFLFRFSVCSLVARGFGKLSIIYIYIWVFPKIGVPQNTWFRMENPIKMDDLGVPLFSETSICISRIRWLRGKWSFHFGDSRNIWRIVRSRERDHRKTMAKHHLKKFAFAQKLNIMIN